MTTLAIAQFSIELPALKDAVAFLLALGDATRSQLASTPATVLSPDTRPPVDLAANNIGRTVTRATTEAELDAYIGEALEYPYFLRMFAIAWEVVGARTAPDTISLDDAAREYRDVDTPTSRLIAQGYRLMGELARVLVALLEEPEFVSAAQAASDTIAARRLTVADIVADPEMPPIVARHVLAMFRAIVAQLGIYELIRERGVGGMLAHPMAFHLASRWIASLRQYLRLFASLRPGLVPESIIPASERLDLVAIDHAHRATRARLRAVPRAPALEDLPEPDDD